MLDIVYDKLKTEYADKRGLWDLDIAKKWGQMPATEKQKELVAKFAPIFAHKDLTKLEASQILSRKFAPEPVTSKQDYFLRIRGYDTSELTRQEAARLIAKIKQAS